jgi:hypothetical protein
MPAGTALTPWAADPAVSDARSFGHVSVRSDPLFPRREQECQSPDFPQIFLAEPADWHSW